MLKEDVSKSKLEKMRGLIMILDWFKVSFSPHGNIIYIINTSQKIFQRIIFFNISDNSFYVSIYVFNIPKVELKLSQGKYTVYNWKIFDEALYHHNS